MNLRDSSYIPYVINTKYTSYKKKLISVTFYPLLKNIKHICGYFVFLFSRMKELYLLLHLQLITLKSINITFFSICYMRTVKIKINLNDILFMSSDDKIIFKRFVWPNDIILTTQYRKIKQWKFQTLAKSLTSCL